MKIAPSWLLFLCLTARLCSASGVSLVSRDKPFLESELIFPLEHWHNHASCIVECPNGSLLVCWYHGSGERTADDVLVLGARQKRGSRQWSAPFVMADTPGYPDTNPAMFIVFRIQLARDRLRLAVFHAQTMQQRDQTGAGLVFNTALTRDPRADLAGRARQGAAIQAFNLSCCPRGRSLPGPRSHRPDTVGTRCGSCRRRAAASWR